MNQTSTGSFLDDAYDEAAVLLARLDSKPLGPLQASYWCVQLTVGAYKPLWWLYARVRLQIRMSATLEAQYAYHTHNAYGVRAHATQLCSPPVKLQKSQTSVGI